MEQRPLKFCMVTTFYPPYNFGGDGIFVHRLSNELGRRGHLVDVVHCVDAYQTLSSGDVQPKEDYPNHPNVTVHSLRSKAGFLSPLITQQTGHPGLKASPLKEVLDKGKHDVINFHNLSLIGPSVLSYGTGIKLYTMHEHWLVCPMHVLWKFNEEACTRKNCLACTLHGKRPPQLWRYTNFLSSTLKHVDAFIAFSRFSRDKHWEMGLPATAPIKCIPSFVPDSIHETSPEESGLHHQRPYFLYVGRLEKMKGVQVAIDAFRNYRQADLLIAGDGKYETALRLQAQGLSHVRFLGNQSYDRLQSLLRNAIALLVPSVGYETFGTVIVEAFAQRTPVIAHNLGPLPEIVEQSEGGLVYDNEPQLLAALELLQTDGERRRELGQRGYSAYLKYWTAESYLSQYLKLIDDIRGKEGATAGAIGAMPGSAGKP